MNGVPFGLLTLVTPKIETIRKRRREVDEWVRDKGKNRLMKESNIEKISLKGNIWFSAIPHMQAERGP